MGPSGVKLSTSTDANGGLRVDVTTIAKSDGDGG
jgi:hypothetical protein